MPEDEEVEADEDNELVDWADEWGHDGSIDNILIYLLYGQAEGHDELGNDDHYVGADNKGREVIAGVGDDG